MTRRFSKVSPAVWRSKRFNGLSGNEAKLLYLYFVSSEHQNSIGTYVLPDGYAIADLNWTIEVYRKARSELLTADLIDFDEATHTVNVRRWFQHCPPMNNSHAQSCQRLIAELECESIAERVQADFDDAESRRAPVSTSPNGIADTRQGAQRWPVRIGGRV